MQKQAANDALLNTVSDNNKFESVKELLAMLNGKDDDKSFDQLVGAVITAALGENGAITTAISDAITAAIGDGGSITNAISSGASAAITAAIGENGAITTWADGRYEPKSAQVGG